MKALKISSQGKKKLAGKKAVKRKNGTGLSTGNLRSIVLKIACLVASKNPFKALLNIDIRSKIFLKCNLEELFFNNSPVPVLPDVKFLLKMRI